MHIKITVVAAALALAGCQQQEYNDWSVNNPLETVTARSAEGFEWRKGDLIKVFSSSEAGDWHATYEAQNDGASSSFKPYAYSTAAVKAETFRASYPADFIDFEKGGGEFPASYDCTGASRDIPMVATLENGESAEPGEFEFAMSCSVLEIKLTSPVPVGLKSITLRSDVNISGKGRFSEAGGVPFIKISTGQPEVVYNYSGIELGAETVFYAVLPANVALGSLSVDVVTTGKSFSKTLAGFDTGMGQIFSVSMTYPEIYNAKIYESSTYTSFADLTWYKDRYYCAFRDGQNHVPSNSSERNGEIRILQSKDCREWTQAALLTDDKYDLRDPHFCISPKDGSLLLFYAYHEVGNSWVAPSKTVVSVMAQDGNALKEQSRTGLDAGEYYSRWWIWNINVSDDTIYGVGYYETGCNVALLQSKDGFKWELISEIPFLGNESSINIIDGKAYVLMRNQTDWLDASMAVADYPFTTWTVTPMNFGIHSPAGVEYNGKLYLCGRKYINKVRDGVSLFSYDLPTSTSLKEVYALPCDKKTGDNAYPGVIIRDGAMRIVYYSIDENKNVPDIHYTEIPLDMFEQNSIQ